MVTWHSRLQVTLCLNISIWETNKNTTCNSNSMAGQSNIPPNDGVTALFVGWNPEGGTPFLEWWRSSWIWTICPRRRRTRSSVSSKRTRWSAKPRTRKSGGYDPSVMLYTWAWFSNLFKYALMGLKDFL